MSFFSSLCRLYYIVYNFSVSLFFDLFCFRCLGKNIETNYKKKNKNKKNKKIA